MGKRLKAIKDNWWPRKFDPAIKAMGGNLAPEAITLDDSILDELKSAAFEQRIASLRPGREAEILGPDPLVSKLIRAMESTPRASDVVEHLLDLLFKDARRGEDFQHTELVMALLFAASKARISGLETVLRFLAESKPAEIARLSRFAKRLLRP